MSSMTLHHTLTTTVVMAFIAASTLVNGSDMSKRDIRQGYQKHAALAQYYRWYQMYERPDGGIDNALDILAKDINVVSALGEARGHEQYAERVAQLPDTWENAHHVKDTQITINDDGSMDLIANITYMNKGINVEGKIREADLTYSMVLAPTETVLPKFTEINIAQNSEGLTEKFEDAYVRNRLLSLVHYWLALIEDPSRNPEPVRELLADEFSLNFSSGAITDFDGFETWLAGPGSSIDASTHEIGNFTYKPLDNSRYSLSVEFDWTGILPNGDEMVARTLHNWAVSNDLTERFARIEQVDVEVLEDFRPKGQ